MKAFRVIYTHGHFVDIETNERLVPVQGEEYVISAKDNAFKTEDLKLKIEASLKTKEKEAWAYQEFGKDNCIKLLNADTQLCFRVGNSRRIEGDENHQYIFVCTLLEDLYLYLLKGKKGDEAEHWRLAECKSKLESCLLGGLTLSEKIPAKSLNALFNNTVQFHFSLQRSASANVFNTFFIYEKGMQITFAGATWKHYENLGKLRERFVAKRNQD